VVFKDLQKLVSQSQQQKENTCKELFQRLQGKPFWIWNMISFSFYFVALPEVEFVEVVLSLGEV
jgi:hypothetical protein